jgi:hypothetical protein
MAKNKVVIVTVHGTGDTADSVAGDKWWQQGSAFSERLRQRLAQNGVEADLSPLRWSGQNKGLAREQGADKLADTVKRLSRSYSGVHIIGHSHGGNVANIAADLVRWGRSKQGDQRIASITTVGTPFLKSQTGWPESLAGLLFLAITFLSTLVGAAIMVLWGVATVFPSFVAEEGQTAIAQGGLRQLVVADEAWFVWVVGAFFYGSIFYMMRLAIQGARRITRPRSPKGANRAIFNIWHRNDEAIAFLQNVEAVPIEPFPRGALFRGAKMPAVKYGVIAVLLSAMAGTVGVFLNPEARGAELNTFFTYTMIGLILAPLIFLIVYWTYRLIVGGVMEVLLRGKINSWVGNILRGMAFGKDGDQKLGWTSTDSHTLLSTPYILEGAVQERMQSGANVAAQKLIDKYRWALFSVGAENTQSLDELTKDTMTWDSLIHTTYFDQPELADIIADYIISETKNRGG